MDKSWKNNLVTLAAGQGIFYFCIGNAIAFRRDSKSCLQTFLKTQREHSKCRCCCHHKKAANKNRPNQHQQKLDFLLFVRLLPLLLPVLSVLPLLLLLLQGKADLASIVEIWTWNIMIMCKLLDTTFTVMHKTTPFMSAPFSIAIVSLHWTERMLRCGGNTVMFW